MQEILEEKPAHKYQLDLWRVSQIILEEAGIPKEQIEVSGEDAPAVISTGSFSHRATGGRTGKFSRAS